LSDLTPGHVTVLEAILSGPLASLGLYDDPSQSEIEAATEVALDFGLERILNRPFRLLSSGERQKTLLARAAMARPRLLILDEPVACLDMGGRERFLSQVGRIAKAPSAPSVILTTHSIQEIGPFVSHAILIKAGRIVAKGPVETVLTSENLSQLYDLPFKVEKTDGGRWLAYLK
jgi:iron complex transport system ATP-binding protein